VVVGGGPAGLAAAIRLKQINPEPSVVVVEKGSEVGAHILAGAVIHPIGLYKLLPGWREDPACPLKVQVTGDRSRSGPRRSRLEALEEARTKTPRRKVLRFFDGSRL
jgi:flavin-dependent dehydrogenase